MTKQILMIRIEPAEKKWLKEMADFYKKRPSWMPKGKLSIAGVVRELINKHKS